VAAMQPSAKADADIGKPLPGLTARLIKEWVVGLNSILANQNASIIFLNHLIDKFDMGGPQRPGMGKPTTTPGGIAMKYFVSTRVQYTPGERQQGTVRDPLSNELVPQTISTDVIVKVQKNRVAPPFRKATVRVRFGKGFDNFWTAIGILVSAKKIIYTSPYYKFHNVETIPGLVPEWMPHLKEGTKPPAIQGVKKLLKVSDVKPEWRDAVIAYAEQIVKDNIELLAKEDAPEEVDEDEEDFETETLALDEVVGKPAPKTSRTIKI
jgi:hypothetical protein